MVAPSLTLSEYSENVGVGGLLGRKTLQLETKAFMGGDLCTHSGVGEEMSRFLTLPRRSDIPDV